MTFGQKMLKFRLDILKRFQEDAKRLGMDLGSQATKIIAIGKDKDDMEWMATEVERVFRDEEYRLGMMVDSMMHQSFQLGAMEQIFMQFPAVRWVLEPGAEHCPDCVALAEIGIFTAETLPGIPGDEQVDTECDGGCRCSLVPLVM
ncbi:MAG: hypothetical protein ACOZAL_00565 [Patescibacteria group bacterium]